MTISTATPEPLCTRNIVKYLFGLISLVAIVVGILYANGVFNPRLSDGESERLSAHLRSIRLAIEMYKKDHHGQFPDLQAHGWLPLTSVTDADGNFLTQYKPFLSYGPYYRPALINPLRNSSAICFVYANPPSGFRPSSEYGFIYIESSKRFYALNADGTLFEDIQSREWGFER